MEDTTNDAPTYEPLPTGRRASNFKNLTNGRYVRWLVLGYLGRQGSAAMWWCRCDCGNHKRVAGWTLTGGQSTSCGCLRGELLAERVTTHGMTRRGAVAPIYSVWANMIARCYNPKSDEYHNYGQRGIVVCERWRASFASFLADVGHPPFPGAQIDRKDVNGGYELSNTRWVNNTVQARNRRDTVYVTFRGERLSVYDAAERVGLKPKTVKQRLRRGWTDEQALAEPLRPGRALNHGSIRK